MTSTSSAKDIAGGGGFALNVGWRGHSVGKPADSKISRMGLKYFGLCQLPWINSTVGFEEVVVDCSGTNVKNSC